MKLSTVMPTSGQFAMVWEWEGGVWCDTFLWEGDLLLIYSDAADAFIECRGYNDILDHNPNKRFIVL